mmetsp:Transcript_2304/g.4903  ORF Transcript_2304/g.4903 Transcript_2304/m.4903 type:complete len:157 (+) Transcript_2304:117-587(+)|eukprot:CAMPEP_0173224216 /NCGR_PEP_ID=MMETSP1142-20121109/4205_1 /TAXON_ID=483371 /ORGANISM="non described non described, Strain CCMP2298" /LENGTH=156 /DNA_ID=CAMNT_0014152437 /DNA_START=61 /DNA_END=531 /DNA_ORIENTATION=+
MQAKRQGDVRKGGAGLDADEESAPEDDGAEDEEELGENGPGFADEWNPDRRAERGGDQDSGRGYEMDGEGDEEGYDERDCVEDEEEDDHDSERGGEGDGEVDEEGNSEGDGVSEGGVVQGARAPAGGGGRVQGSRAYTSDLISAAPTLMIGSPTES